MGSDLEEQVLVQRPAIAVLSWVTATAVATGAAVAGVGLVTGQVVEPLPPIAVGTPTGMAAPDTGVPSGGAPASSSTPGSTTSAPSAGGTQTPPASSPGPASSPPATSARPASPVSTPSPPVSDDDIEGDEEDEHEEAEEQLKTYSVVGGSVTLRFAPGQVDIVSVTPKDGFTVSTERDGYKVRVEFSSATHRSTVEGSWESGNATFEDEVSEEDR